MDCPWLYNYTMLLNLCSMSAGDKGNSIRHIWGLAERGGFARSLYNLGGTVLGVVYGLN